MGASAKERQQLVDENAAFVRALAAKLKESLPREVEFEDLVQHGMEGLLEAADRYDRKFGVQFTTFAWYRVRGAMFDGLRRMGYTTRADRRLRFEEGANGYLANLADRELGAARASLQPDPGGDLEDEVRAIAEALGGVAAIFMASADAAEQARSPDDALEERERHAAVGRALVSLPEKERRLLELYYYQELSIEEAGAQLGVSKSWSSRLHARAITLLYEALRSAEHVPRAGPPEKQRARRR
jgi:RNA polymerase sigma factor for flagellar operon FliA